MHLDPLAYARTMARYNRWMNERIYACAATLGDAVRKRDQGAFFRSIHGTLNHLLLADRIWMARFARRDYAVVSLDQELYAEFDELNAARRAMDDDIEQWVASLRVTDLAERLSYMSISNPAPKEPFLWLALTHFFNHQTHHRGQVTTLLYQCGADPGVTDLIAMPLPPAVMASGT